MDAGILIVMIVLLALSAFFSATETAFSTFNRIRMKNMAQNGNKRAKLVLKLDEKYDKLINTILIGNNIVNIALSSIATIFFVDLLKNTDESVSATISTAVITVWRNFTEDYCKRSCGQSYTRLFIHNKCDRICTIAP